MITKIKNHLTINKSKYFLGILLFSSFLIRVWYSFNYNLIWWDEAVYVDMGKYLATFGHIGFWEFFRPPLLPIFYAVLYKLHLPLISFGKIIVVFTSTGLIYLVYLLAEKTKKRAGIWAGLFLSITPVFFYFSKIGLSDITSAFIATLALHFFINRRDFLSGVFIGISFLTRFPQGLILAPILISLLYREHNEKDFYFKRIFYSGFKIVSGFFVLVVPYLISNYFLYGDVLRPIQYANQIVSFYYFLYFKGFWYYTSELWRTAPFLSFSIFSLVIVFFQIKKNRTKNIPLITTFITAIIFCAYFFLQPHKELRYSIAFLPYISILAGVSVIWILDIIPYKNILKTVFILGIILFLYQIKNYVIFTEVDEYKAFYNFFNDKSGTYISTTPIPAVNSNILIAETFESYNAQKSFKNVLNLRFNHMDGVIINSCDIFCEAKAVGGSCEREINNIYDGLKDNFKLVYGQKIGECNASVFEKIK